MKKLLLAIVAVLALTGAASAFQMVVDTTLKFPL